jgi:hypothetical protein
MSRMVITFIVLTLILLLGILIMMKPDVFVLKSQTNEKFTVNQTLAGSIVPKEIIILASTFIIVGMVGLCVLGFRIFKELGLNDSQKKA